MAKFNVDKWLAAHKAAVARCGTAPSGAEVGLRAHLTYIKEALIDDVGPDTETAAAITEGLTELYVTAQQAVAADGSLEKNLGGFCVAMATTAKINGFTGKGTTGVLDSL